METFFGIFKHCCDFPPIFNQRFPPLTPSIFVRGTNSRPHSFCSRSTIPCMILAHGGIISSSKANRWIRYTILSYYCISNNLLSLWRSRCQARSHYNVGVTCFTRWNPAVSMRWSFKAKTDGDGQKTRNHSSFLPEPMVKNKIIDLFPSIAGDCISIFYFANRFLEMYRCYWNWNWNLHHQ